MREFAKVFESGRYGQLLVMIQRSDDTADPELRLFCCPPGLHVCSVALEFCDDATGWDHAEDAFAQMTVSLAEEWVRQSFVMPGLIQEWL
jgi:hypothetical protein